MAVKEEKNTGHEFEEDYESEKDENHFFADEYTTDEESESDEEEEDGFSIFDETQDSNMHTKEEEKLYDDKNHGIIVYDALVLILQFVTVEGLSKE
jgi:hypothetical protein